MNTTIAQQIANEGGVEAYLHAQQHKSLLRFLTCGSVDDGKSTLIGRLLHDTRQIYEDQLSSLHNDSKRHGTGAKKLDWRCWWTACRLSASRASPSTWPIATSRPKSANLSSPTPRGTGSTRAIWPPGRPPATGDPADRCAQGRARPDSPSQLHLDAAGH